MGRPRSRSFIVEEDDELDPDTMLPKSALKPRQQAASPAPHTARSGALNGSALRIVSNLEHAARLATSPRSSSSSGLSPRSDDEHMMRRRGSGTAGAGHAGAGSGNADPVEPTETVKEKELVVRLLLLGDSGVGKTSLIHRFVKGAFKSTIMTAGVDFTVSHITVDGKKVKLQIWDTAGQERFHVITRAYYKGVDGIILLYDVSDVAGAESFHNVRYWMDTIRQHGNPTGVEKVLVGNKVDLPAPKIEASRGRALADQFGLKFFETSAKTGSGVKQMFTTITRDIVKRMARGTDSDGDGRDKKKCTIM